ncbi:MAG: primosomal protein N', partial [Gammaproteobacteria bacterium]|nr:primosomal protein N' [Gammaproteobacteria bacterium]
MILKVAIDAPLMALFDYLPPAGAVPVRAGQRVLVPFRNARRVGVVVGSGDSSPVPSGRLRRVLTVLDAEPLLDERLMALLEWASSYYQHPPGEVFAAALPRLLRTERSGEAGLVAWQITLSGQAALAAGELARAPVQQRLLEALDAAGAEGLANEELEILAAGWREASRQLQRKGWTVRMRRDAVAAACAGNSETAPEPTPAQAAALADIVAARGFQAFLLEGVTGSGKTEVYLRAIAARLAAGRQSLV